MRFLDGFPSIRPRPSRAGTPTIGERRARTHSGDKALGHVRYSEVPLPALLPATLIAFYLPQFHAIPENDAWWGKGFTEWRNVTRALPQFEGHGQPRLPGDLGFYDLHNPQTMRDQASLAQAYGVGAFCFYFYWFGGKTLLEAPLLQWLDDDSITLPFCLCWANENWSRRWDGRAADVLVAQTHGADDDLAFIAHVSRYFRDRRYLRVDGKPLLLVYRPGTLPDAAATAQRWREWCRVNGIGEIFIAYVQAFERPDPRDIGFDAAVEFPPNLSTPSRLNADQKLINPEFAGEVLDWRELACDYMRRSLPDYTLFPGVNCGWDNTPRQPEQGRVYLHSSPHAYEEWLRATVHERLAGVPASHRLVFINAWNEWAEGAVLEPDLALGHAWLDATRSALLPVRTRRISGTEACVVVHAWYPETFGEIAQVLGDSGIRFRVVVTTSPDRADAIRRIVARHGLTAELELGPNRGRDVLPFLQVMHRLRREGEQLVLKLHTKHSPHLPDGAHWRKELIDRLASPGRARPVLDAMAADPTLGLVVAEGHVASMSGRIGANLDNLRYLAARCGLARPSTTATFPAGSMFWARIDALDPFLDANLREWEFEDERGQIDGTLAHAIERMFATAAAARGLRVVEAGTLVHPRPGAS